MSSGISPGPMAGNTSSSIMFGMKPTISISSIEEFAQFLKDCQATTYLDANQSAVLAIGTPGAGNVATKCTIAVGEENMEIVLYHRSFNYGVGTVSENVIINLNGHEKKIPISYFTKDHLAMAFELTSPTD